MADNPRALACLNAIEGLTARTQTREGLTLEIRGVPLPHRNDAGDVVGIGVDVVAYWQPSDGPREELPIDGHRIFINPPTAVQGNGTTTLETHDGTQRRVPRSRVDPIAAFWDVLFDGVVATPAPENWGVRGTVTTVFSSTADHAVRSFSGTYANARAGTGSLALRGDNTLTVGQLESGGVWECWQSFLDFDTSAIPDTDVVSAVVLSVRPTFDLFTIDVTVEARLFDWGATVTTADFRPGADLGALTLLASVDTTAGWSTSAYSNFTSQAAFLTNINKTGVTRMVICSAEQTNNSAPGTGLSNFEIGDFAGAEASGTSTDPQLVVTHAAGGTTYDITPAGTITPAGALAKQAGKIAAGAATPAGAIRRQANKAASGTVTPAGALARALTLLRTYTGTVTPAGALAKQASKNAAGTITPTGDASMIKVVLRTLAGTITPAGSLARAGSKGVAAAIAASGALSKAITGSDTGTITPAGADALHAATQRAGTVSPQGSVGRSTEKRVSALLSATGGITRAAAKALQGMITPAGALTIETTGALQVIWAHLFALDRPSIARRGLDQIVKLGQAVDRAILHRRGED